MLLVASSLLCAAGTAGELTNNALLVEEAVALDVSHEQHTVAIALEVHHVTCTVGDFGECTCPAPLRAVGGLCDPVGSGGIPVSSLFSTNSPNSDGSGWTCGGGGASKLITVMCANINTKISYASGDGNSVATCPHEAPNLIGGGCSESNGIWYSTSIPMGTDAGLVNQWKCADSGHADPKFEVRAICSASSSAQFAPKAGPTGSGEVQANTAAGTACDSANR